MSYRLAIALILILALAVPATAAQQLYVRSDEAGNEVLWRLAIDGRKVWEAHDIAARGTPDLLFFFDKAGEHYRRVLVDIDGNGSADVVALFDSDRNFRTLYDCDGDGRFGDSCPGGMGEITEQFLDVILRVNLRMALERRIESDRYPEVYWSTRPAQPARGEIAEGPIRIDRGQSRYLTIDVSWTPAAIGPDTDPKVRPLTITASKILMVQGAAAGTALRGLRAQTSLPDDPDADLAADLDVEAFTVPLDSPADAPRWLLAVNGRLRLPGKFDGGFAMFTELSTDIPAMVTTPVLNADGSHKDLLFFIIQIAGPVEP
ncbi:MAG: hypothetical protein P9M14_05785 [Candidatus Alcyoniella australis]|nr:hypothetical protein [Candidatus Alcyoniella australis]